MVRRRGGVVAVLAALVLLVGVAGCGGGDDGAARTDALDAAAQAVPLPAPSTSWAPAPDQTDGCTTPAGSTVEVAPTRQLVAAGTDAPAPYLDQVEAALPPDARRVQRTDDQLAWTTLGPDGEEISVRVFASSRSTSVTATGPLAWCE